MEIYAIKLNVSFYLLYISKNRLNSIWY